MTDERKNLLKILENVAKKSEHNISIEKLIRELSSIDEPIRKNILTIGRKSLIYLRDEEFEEKHILQEWIMMGLEK